MITDRQEITCWNCNKTYAIDVPVDGHLKWKAGNGLIQEVLPELSDGERELLISGTCDTCWDELFGGPEEEDYE